MELHIHSPRYRSAICSIQGMYALLCGVPPPVWADVWYLRFVLVSCHPRPAAIRVEAFFELEPLL